MQGGIVLRRAVAQFASAIHFIRLALPAFALAVTVFVSPALAVTTVNSGNTLTGDTTTITDPSIIDNGTVDFTQAAAGTYSGVIQGTGTVIKDGAEVLVRVWLPVPGAQVSALAGKQILFSVQWVHSLFRFANRSFIETCAQAGKYRVMVKEEDVLAALDKPRAIYSLQQRLDPSNKSTDALQDLLMRMRTAGTVKFDIKTGKWRKA